MANESRSKENEISSENRPFIIGFLYSSRSNVAKIASRINKTWARGYGGVANKKDYRTGCITYRPKRSKAYVECQRIIKAGKSKISHRWLVITLNSSIFKERDKLVSTDQIIIKKLLDEGGVWARKSSTINLSISRLQLLLLLPLASSPLLLLSLWTKPHSVFLTLTRLTCYDHQYSSFYISYNCSKRWDGGGFLLLKKIKDIKIKENISP